MPYLDRLFLFRMTHIENISHIVQHGLTHSASINSNPNFRPIGDGSLIATRNSFHLTNGRNLGEYIPFYFGMRTPMLYVVQNGYNMVASTPAEDIVYCVSSVQKIIDLQLDFVFTDGHAVDSFSTQYFAADIQNIHNIIDKNAINAKYWRDDNDLDRKRRKEAEFLVLGDIALDGILCYLVYNEKAKETLLNLGVSDAQIRVKPDYYF